MTKKLTAMQRLANKLHKLEDRQPQPFIVDSPNDYEKLDHYEIDLGLADFTKHYHAGRAIFNYCIVGTVRPLHTLKPHPLTPRIITATYQGKYIAFEPEDFKPGKLQVKGLNLITGDVIMFNKAILCTPVVIAPASIDAKQLSLHL
jgi:hypothetical protein